MEKVNRAWQIVLLLAACCATTPSIAALQASVDRNPVNMNESFTLTLETNDNLDGTPDLSALQQNFEVLNQGKSSSFQMINGNTSHSTQWSITLIPKQSGQLRIPPISIGGEQSAPISLTVTASATPTPGATQQGKLFLDVSVSPKNVYVQQQLVYTVRLFHAVNLGHNATLTEPKLAGDDAIVEKLGDDKNFQTTRNGVRYGVVERKYAIYPQHSGKIEIPPLVFDGDIPQSAGNNFFSFDPFGTRSRHQRVTSQPVTITAQGTPASFHGSQWLPASNLQLVEQWSPDPPHFTAGQPVTRTVAIMADGLTAAQLPPLESGAIEGLKQYPDQPSLKDTKASSGITGLHSEKIAMIPKQPGTITLPAITVPWWNTTTNTAELARLPARTVTVIAASGTATSTAPSVSTHTAKPIPKPETPSTTATSADNTPQATIKSTTPGFWPWLTLLMASGWLGTAIAWWRRSRHSAPVVSARQDVKEKVSLSQLEKQIKESCHANDAARCSHELLGWARQRWPEKPPVSLTELAQRCAPPLAAQLKTLDRARYASKEKAWVGESLWQQFSRNKPQEKASTSTQNSALRPLYES